MRRLGALGCIGGGLERHLLPRTVNAPVDLSVCDAATESAQWREWCGLRRIHGLDPMFCLVRWMDACDQCAYGAGTSDAQDWCSRHISAFRPPASPDDLTVQWQCAYFLFRPLQVLSIDHEHSRTRSRKPSGTELRGACHWGDGSDCEPQYPCQGHVFDWEALVFRSLFVPRSPMSPRARASAISLWSRADEQEYTCACESGPVLFLSGHGNHDRPTLGPFSLTS
jgi:hypothetical protein